MSRLVSAQLSMHCHKKHFCDGCLQYFTTRGQLNRHAKEDCTNLASRSPTTDLIKDIRGPEMTGNICKFKSYYKQLKVPFVFYCDFESLLIPLNQTATPIDDESYNMAVQELRPYSFAFYLKCSYDDKLSKFYSYRGEDAADVFCRTLDNKAKRIYDHLKHKKTAFIK